MLYTVDYVLAAKMFGVTEVQITEDMLRAARMSLNNGSVAKLSNQLLAGQARLECLQFEIAESMETVRKIISKAKTEDLVESSLDGRLSLSIGEEVKNELVRRELIVVRVKDGDEVTYKAQKLCPTCRGRIRVGLSTCLTCFGTGGVDPEERKNG